MGEVFELAKEFAGMELPDVNALLEQDIHEARAGAVKIIALQASAKKTPERRRRELFELGWLRDAGRSDRQRLLQFLDTHAPTMPRVALRYAIEHLDRPSGRIISPGGRAVPPLRSCPRDPRRTGPALPAKDPDLKPIELLEVK